MIASLFAVTLAGPTFPERRIALTVDRQPHPAAPIVFALFANRRVAEAHLVAVARAEWDETVAYGQGAAVEWNDAKLLERLRGMGYLATVTEQIVEL